jgi:uncharacterized protein YceH (UPF0502 family)
MSETQADRRWGPLSARERRVLGVLIEKQKTTPDNYPMTIAALVAGCNQKSNRDPITNYDADDIEETLHALRQKGVVVLYEGSGRVERWKHTAYDWLGLKDRPVEMAVLAELLLRGAQTEGDLRSRAGRMAPLPDLPALQAVLDSLSARELVVQLSPPGQRRGVVVSHGLYPPDELARLRQAVSQRMAVEDEEPSADRVERAPARETEVAALRAEVEALRAEVRSLAAEVAALKSDLGAE